MALHQPSDVVRMKSVGVLVGRHQIQDHLAVDLLRQRELHEDAVNLSIAIELVDERH